MTTCLHFNMLASQVLSILNQLETMTQQLEQGLTADDKTLVSFLNLESSAVNLKILLNKKRMKLDQKAAVVNRRMSFDELPLNGFMEYYKSVSGQLEHDKQVLAGKLNALTSFQYPTIELFPGTGIFTEQAVAAEPLYIIDYHAPLLELPSQRFNQFFANKRLFKYVIKEMDVSKLPKEQIGVAFSFNYFPVKNLDFIVDWATAVYPLLRPGGYFIFNFVPNTTVWGLELAESSKFNAIDNIRLQSILESKGYKIVTVDIQPVLASTMLLQKPGQLLPFKISGSTAKIIEKSDPLV